MNQLIEDRLAYLRMERRGMRGAEIDLTRLVDGVIEERRAEDYPGTEIGLAIVRKALQREPGETVLKQAATLAEAHELLQRPEHFNLTLIDLKLPDGSGLELLREIRERELRLAVVMLTGSGDQRAAISALRPPPTVHRGAFSAFLAVWISVAGRSWPRPWRKSVHRPAADSG